jgi:hypothetical protein
MKGKYVMTEQGPILFTDAFAHSDFRGANPTSAGCFLFSPSSNGEEISVAVFGESFTLNLKSNESDADKIKHAFSGNMQGKVRV